MMQVGTNQSTAYHSQPSIPASGGQTGRSSSTSRQQQQQSQYDNEQLANIRPRLCILRKWPHYDGYGVHLARNQHWLGLRIGDVEPNSPAESGGLLREDVVLAVNGHAVENDDFFVILSFIQHELEDDQIRFLVLDPQNADLARRNHINIDENFRTCVRMETPVLTVSPEKLLYDQWRSTNTVDPTAAQNTIHLGPTLPGNQNQANANAQRYQQGPPSDGRDDVYTFLPYSDHAVENGKSFFDILFEQDTNASSTQTQQQQQPARNTIQYSSREEPTGDDNNNDEIDDHKDKGRGSQIKDGVKNLVKSGFENIKSVLPTKHRDSKEKLDNTETKGKGSSEPIDNTPKDAESSSMIDQIKNKFKRSSSPTNTTEQEKQSEPYERLWQTSSQQEDTNKNLAPEPRLCSLSLRPGIDTIGISLQQDKDFGHIIKHVESNSPADRAGIERDDCIVSLNDVPLLNIPYEDVLNNLKKSRNQPNLEFLVAKKSYLLKSNQKKSTAPSTQHETSGKYTDTTAGTTGEVMPSSNITGRNNTSSVPASQALEQLYNKYNDERNSSFDEQTSSSRPRETVSTSTTIDERYDRLSPQVDDDRYSSKQQQQQQGQIFQGVGPATGDRSSWGVSSGKPTEDLPGLISGDSSIRSNSRTRRPDTDETKGRASSLEDSFKPLQVGITNPTPSQQSGNVSPNIPSSTLADDGQRTSRPASSKDQQDSSPKALPSPDTAATSTHIDSSPSSVSKQNQVIQNIQYAAPIAPSQPSFTSRDYEQESIQTTPSTQSDLRLGTTKAMSVPSKPVIIKPAMNVYDDTDDDDLSDISEKSREEDPSDPVVNKNSQSINTESIDNKKDKPISDSSRTASSGFFTPEPTLSASNNKVSSNRNNGATRELTPTSSDADQQENASTPTTKSVVQARRLEQSDSEDTTSATDSHPAKQSVTDTFYSPDESIDDGDDTDDQHSSPGPQRAQNESNQVTSSDNKQNQSLSKSLNQQKKQNKIDGDDDDDNNNSSSESSSTESQKTPVSGGRMALATMPLSELKNHGYEFHNIQLMQPTETSPVGLKLTKQQEPLQYIITAVAKGTKADLAGLKVNDWLIKIEDNDIRSVEFAEVSQDIRQLLTNAGLINMVVARKKTPTSSPITKQLDKQQTTPSSSRSESLNRQQGGPNPTSSSLLTTDITRDTPDNSQVRFIPDQSTSPSTIRSQRSPISTRETNVNTSGGPFSVGLTNPISDENSTRSPRSQSRSPTREYTINQQEKTLLTNQPSDEFDQNDIRHVVLKEALGLDFNSFIPEGDSQVQTHFISNVQQSSMADKAGLRDGDRILTVNGVDVTDSVHEDVRRMMQSKKPLQLTVVNDPKYLELIENVKRSQNKAEGTRDNTNSPPPDYDAVEQEESGGFSESTNRARPPVKSLSSDSGSDSGILQSKGNQENLSKYLRQLFTDDEGSVQVKHCLLKKDPSYNGYGLLLRYQNGLHLIDQVEEGSPAHNAGLREDDVILYVDKKNVEQMTHDDVKILIKKLSLSNTNIDLILIKKNDIQRYKTYQQGNSIDWKPIFQENSSSETIQTEPKQTSVIHSLNQSTNESRKSTSSSPSSSSSGKQQAPAPPSSSTLNQSSSSAGTRVCILQPSVDRTAGFALSGKSPPPYIICQIEKNSPAEKAGLVINDALLAINGKSVTDKSYEDTVKLIKEALQQKSVELLVRSPSSTSSKDQIQNQDRSKIGSQSSISDQGKLSMGSNDSNNLGNNDNLGGEPSRQGSNAVEEYQKQRNKELSYTLRLCHLHPTNGDGTQAATFGFELSEDPDYEYPLILRVESQSPAEGAGLQSRDILLKINERKTKGLGYEKVRKEIEKAKRDGRLEMLVVDQETFDYCKRTKKPLKEPEMKVKHIFPKSRSSASFHKLPIAAAASRDSVDNSNDSLPPYQRTSVGYRLSTPRETDSENEEDNRRSSSKKNSSIVPSQTMTTTHHAQSAVNFDLTTPSTPPAISASTHSHESPLKFFDPAQTASQQTGTSSKGAQSVPHISRSTPALNQTSTKDSKGSKSKAIPNAINSLLHKIGHPKSSKPNYEAPPKTTARSKARAPSPPTVRVGHNRLDASRVSQSLDTGASNTTSAPISSMHDTVRSTISTGSFDYLRGPRRCVLKVDRNKGLGFVLSATGDYDHTITAVEKNSAADIAGLQANDEVIEVDGVDVRTVKYEQVVEMLVSAMRTNESIEMRVTDSHSRDVDKQTNSNGLLNSNNNNNNNNAIGTMINQSQRTTVGSGDDLSDINSSISAFDSLNQQKFATSYPNLPGQLKQFDSVTNRALSGSVPALATGITASPNGYHHIKSISTSSEKGSITKLSDISTHEAPIARLCRIRKFATSPFYGFFLCGDPKKLGRVFISDVTKHSPAAVCGLRDGDRIVEINGTTIDTFTYEVILDKIKEHMARDDLELLVLDKKSFHWYRERNYPITSRTLPTIVHMEPIINDGTTEIQSSEVPTTQTKMVGFADRRVSKTGL